jgi:hypothetical protein
MRIRRAAPWCHCPSKPAEGQDLKSLPKTIRFDDIAIVRTPKGCQTLREAYDTLKAQGETFLDGQILMTIMLNEKDGSVSAWHAEGVGTYSYVVFAAVLIDFKAAGDHRGFPALGWADNGETAELSMMGWEEVLPPPDDEDPVFFAVMRKSTTN